MKETALVLATAFFCYMYHYEDEIGMFFSFMFVVCTLGNDGIEALLRWANKKSGSTANTDAQNK